MSTPTAIHRCGRAPAFTLVELLVVIAILLLLTVTTIPLLSPSDVQKVRDAAITVNGMITRVKAEASRHNARGAGLWLKPVDDSGAVLDMFTSLTLDPWAGDDPDTARVDAYKPDVTWGEDWGKYRLVHFPKASFASVGDICHSSTRAKLGSYDACRFQLLRTVELGLPEDPDRPYVGLLGPLLEPTPSIPSPVSNQTISIDRPNARAPTPPLTLPSGYAVDLKWCAWGNTFFSSLPISWDGPIQLMFTADGLPKELVYRGKDTITRNGSTITIEYDAHVTNLGDIFLLVGRADRCGNAGNLNDPSSMAANWQYPDSRWIRISRAGGQVTVSEPYPNATSVEHSMTYARAGIPVGRG